MGRKLLLLLPLWAFIACVEEKKTFKGKYKSSFENSTFIPDGITEKWWLEVGNNEIKGKLEGNTYDLGKPRCFENVIVEGILSNKGRHGHLGMYDRNLGVTKVVNYQQIECENP